MNEYEREERWEPSQEDLYDQLKVLIDLKTDFLKVLNNVVHHIDRASVEDHYVACEQQFDDLLCPTYNRFADKCDYPFIYPVSERGKAWAAKSKPSASELLYQALKPPTKEEVARVFAPQTTRGLAPTNPATLMAKGEV